MHSATENTDRRVVNVATYLRKMARSQPYQRAVVYPYAKDRQGRIAYTHLTFRQLDIESDCMAQGLDGIGISRGVRTILMVKPSLDFFALVFALFKVGAVPVVVDPGMGVMRMLGCLKESRAQALIGIPRAHLLRTLAPKYFTTVTTAVTVGPRWFWSGPTLRQVRNRQWDPYPMAQTTADEIAAILFTTGSTGPAKGVFYTHGVFDAQVRNIRDQFGIGPGEIDLPTFPLFALFDPALGMTAIIPDMDPTKPARVNPEKIIEAIVNHGVTNMFASPALLNRVGLYGTDKGIKLPPLKRIITAGAPATPANIEQFSGLLVEDARIHTGYGATEAMPVSAFGSDEILNKTRKLSEQGFGMCVGRPITGVDVRIIQISDGPIAIWTDDLVMPEGETGEIVVRGEQVTRGYYERPRDDRLAKIHDGDTVWHRMGDLGWMDKKGRIWFCGRKSHRVTTEKGTLFTIPCEAIFNNHPRVFRSALVGVGPKGHKHAVICIELESGDRGKDKARLKTELLELARTSPITEDIDTILFHRAFPVDIRHNSKIFREKLAVWAAKQLKMESSQ
ncbi:peptide synthase [Desulfosarcina ovata subsp. sediminis]|uniref:Peptide synthase n=1 Tax=Desulfosarcina ovata subsp. sediminis TaxID=885957 RepID=A0A5K7ZGF3_9BACT|nr:fatty acid CoA ligase family protein [Desulfosarcina ovata]BBO80036.1 peptide synthase [Desulfosarcina ovata subsp. sediminis]